ncbi:MAG: hypothetical protein HZB16_19675 [Armatimonadetes bacterium]|nr:hypothetical protein [Armatimonadota bacterium]
MMTLWLAVPPLTAVAAGAWLLDQRWPARIRRLGAAVCLMLALLAGLAAPVVDRVVERVQHRRLWALTPRLAPVVDALAAYQRDHGQPPKELSDLVPAYLASEPGPALLRGAVLRYNAAARTLVYRLSRGALRLDISGGRALGKVVGVEGTPVAHFDAMAWRRGRPVGQGLAFARDVEGHYGLRALVAMLGVPDAGNGPDEATWSLSLAMPMPSRLTLRYVPAEAVGAPGQVGRWTDVRD